MPKNNNHAMKEKLTPKRRVDNKREEKNKIFNYVLKSYWLRSPLHPVDKPDLMKICCSFSSRSLTSKQNSVFHHAQKSLGISLNWKHPESECKWLSKANAPHSAKLQRHFNISHRNYQECSGLTIHFINILLLVWPLFLCWLNNRWLPDRIVRCNDPRP